MVEAGGPLSDLDAASVLVAGGWDARFAVVRAVATVGDRAAAVIDSNGDGADINLEHYLRIDGSWTLRSSGGGAGDWGRGWRDGLWAEHDCTDGEWWLTLEEGVQPDHDAPPEVRDVGWWASTD